MSACPFYYVIHTETFFHSNLGPNHTGDLNKNAFRMDFSSLFAVFATHSDYNGSFLDSLNRTRAARTIEGRNLPLPLARLRVGRLPAKLPNYIAK